MSVKLIISDIDGVWTDGGMYYMDNGIEVKKFNTSDSVGLLLAKTVNIDVIIISGEDSLCVRNRLKKLNLKEYFLGIKDKVKLVEQIAKNKSLDFKQIAFIGDEVNDYALLKKVGFSSCPQSGPYYTREIVDYITPSIGGMGAFRDFVIEILKRERKFKYAFDILTKNK